MSQAEKAGEPSMEEILSSIRKIISEDPVAKSPAAAPPPPASVAAAPAKPTPAQAASGLLASLSRAVPTSFSPGPNPSPNPAMQAPVISTPAAAPAPIASLNAGLTAGPGQPAPANSSTDSLDDILGLADSPGLASVAASAPGPVATPAAKPSLSLPSWMTQKPAPAAHGPAAQPAAPQPAAQAPFERAQLERPASQPHAVAPAAAPITLPPQTREAPVFQPAQSAAAFDASSLHPSRSDFGAVVPGRAAPVAAPQTSGPRFSDIRPDALADRLNGGTYRAPQVRLHAASEPEPEPNGRDGAAESSEQTSPSAHFTPGGPHKTPAADPLPVQDTALAAPVVTPATPKPEAQAEAVLKPGPIPEPIKVEMPAAVAPLPRETISAPLADVRSAPSGDIPAMAGSRPVASSAPIVSAPVVSAPVLTPSATTPAVATPAIATPAIATPLAAPAAVSQPSPAIASSPAVATGTPDEPTRTMEDTVAELLRPMLRQWLDTNMPRVVEKALRVELAASAKLKPDSAKH